MLYNKYICLFILIIGLLFFNACTTSRSAAGPELEAFGERLGNKSYEIQANWAFPLMTQGITQVANSGLLMPGSNANRIDLMGNASYFRVEGDSVSINLPYFGERQIGGGYGDPDVGINFEGVPLSYALKKEEKQNRYKAEIRIRDDIETLVINLFLFPSGKADINVNSTHRSSIRYTGELQDVKDE